MVFTDVETGEKYRIGYITQGVTERIKLERGKWYKVVGRGNLTLNPVNMLKKIVLFPISLFVAFLALMAKWLLTLSSYVVAPLMLYIFGCGIYTACRQTWDQFLILLVAEFICFILFFGATAITEGIGRFSEWLAEL